LTIGLDTNILCYALDPAYPEHTKLQKILLELSSTNTIAVNPTVLHETYHVLVFYSQWIPNEAANRLKMILKHPYIKFCNQTKQTSQLAINLATKHNLGGRDALIVANFLQNKIPLIYTHDNELLRLGIVSWKAFTAKFEDPTRSNI
jgi:predicted nucleic acid-binding protein